MFGNKNTGNSVVFARFNAAKGKFVIDAQEGEDGAVLTYKDDGTPGKWARMFETAEGMVVRLQHVVDKTPQNTDKNILRMRMRSTTPGEPDSLITFTVSALSVAKMLGALNAADLSKPVRLVSSFFPKGSVSIGDRKLDKPLESDQVFLSVFTEAGYVAPNYGSEDLPKSREVRVGNKIVYDTSERETFTIKLIEHLNQKVQSLQPATSAQKQASSPQSSNNVPASGIPAGFGGSPDDLPPPEAYADDAERTPFSI